MRLYKPNVTSINIDGEDYHADSQGVIDLPDHLASDLFSDGWVDARGHLSQLARAEKAAHPDEIKAIPEPKIEPALASSQDSAVKKSSTGAMPTAKI